MIPGKRRDNTVNDPTESDSVLDALESEDFDSKRLCIHDGTSLETVSTIPMQSAAATILNGSDIADCLRVAWKAVDILDHLNSPGFKEHLVNSSRSARNLQCSHFSLSHLRVIALTNQVGQASFTGTDLEPTPVQGLRTELQDWLGWSIQRGSGCECSNSRRG